MAVHLSFDKCLLQVNTSHLEKKKCSNLGKKIIRTKQANLHIEPTQPPYQFELIPATLPLARGASSLPYLFLGTIIHYFQLSLVTRFVPLSFYK